MKKNSTIRSLLCIAVFFALMTVFAVQAGADSVELDLSEASVTIGKSENEDGKILVTHGENSYTLSENGEVVITSSAITRNTVFIKDNIAVSVVLRNVTIENPYFLKSPVCLDNGEEVSLYLEGENRLVSTDNMAGIQVGRYAEINIKGEGTLEVYGGKYGAGIGGGWRSGTDGTDCGTIVIEDSVTVRAYGGEEAAGIGGGRDGSPDKIIFRDSARVYAAGGKNGAGIGGGSDVFDAISESFTIELCEDVYAEALGGELAAGIGGGKNGDVKSIYITDNAAVRVLGGADAAAIGSGSGKKTGIISISGNASVRAKGGSSSSAIGSSYYGKIDNIEIKGNANVYAIGEVGAAAIGTGLRGTCKEILISDNASVEAFAGRNGAGIGSGQVGTVTSLNITGKADVKAVGGANGAGIGFGSSGELKNITIDSEASVIAIGGKHGAGIGSGADSTYMPRIMIKGKASVIAQGGNYGAGIGYGGKFIEDVFISDGYVDITDNAVVKAAGGMYAAGIGGGKYSAGVTLNVSGNAVVTAKANIKIEVEATPVSTVDTENDVVGPVINVKYEYKHSDYAFKSYLLQPYEETTEQPSEDSLVEPLNHVYEYGDINYNSADIMDENVVKKEEAKDIGAGAGCLFQGSLIIKGNAKVNDMVGDVTVTLVYGIGGFEDQITSLKKGDRFTFPTPEKEGYIFEGWYDSKDGETKFNGSVKVEADSVYYAGWKIIGVAITSEQPKDAFVGDEYSQVVFSASGGARPYSYRLSDGALPKGMILGAEDGSLSGIPEEPGIFEFTVTVVDGNGSANSSYASLKVYGNNTFRFVIKTSADEAAGTNGKVTMKFDYIDNFTGEKKTSELFDITEVIGMKYETPLSAGSEQQIDVVFPPNVGRPVKIYLESTSEDGWKCESVSALFTGTKLMEAFSQSFDFNTWFGTRDDGGMSFGDVVLLVLIIIGVAVLLAVIIIVITRIDRMNRGTRSKKSGTTSVKKNISSEKKR